MPSEHFDVDNEGLARLIVIVALETIGASVPDRTAHGVTVEDIHRFVRESIEYAPDNAGQVQRIRAPWITIEQAMGDCKSTALLALALARCAGLSNRLRFYDQSGSGWDHVIAVVDGVPCDPLLPLGSEVPYLHVRDVYI